jgi:hypothetical protein
MRPFRERGVSLQARFAPGWRTLAALVAALALLSGCQSFRERSAKENSLATLAPQERTAVDAVVRRGIERCVTIRPGFMTLGSGCLVAADGWILTAEHVVRGRRVVDVELYDGKTFEGQVVATSAGNDFALVKIAADTPKYFRIGHRPALGDRVIAIGTATKWVSPNASAGVVIYPQVRIPGEEGTYYYDAIFHSAPIFPGDSGGPLLDLSGDLVGIHGGFASESASVAPATVEILRLIPGGGKKKLSIDLFDADLKVAGRFPIVWPAHVPKDFAESSAWTIASVEDTLVEVYSTHNREVVRQVLSSARERFLVSRLRDRRKDDELVRAMLADVFRQLEERTRAQQGPAGQTLNSSRRPRRRRRRRAAAMV